jgi:hypothetical protein
VFQFFSFWNISASKKRDILKGVIDTIEVDYDSAQKLHILNLTYKLPVYFRDAEEGRGATRVSELDSIKNTKTPSQLNGSGLQGSNQNGTVGGYSTVMGYFSCLDEQAIGSKSYTLRLNVELKSANLWTSAYSDHQESLFATITQLHDKEGWNFVQISDFLNSQGYKTPRGNTFTQSHAWSIYTKKKRSIERFSREFDPSIKSIQVEINDDTE